MTPCITATLQLNSQDDLAANLRLVETLIRQAAEKGAQLLTLPENAFFMQAFGKNAPAAQETGIELCAKLASELKVWILIGSAHVPSGTGKSWNRSLLLDDQGKTVAQYDKIHLFDVTLKNGEAYSESARFDGGYDAVLAHTPWGKLGMTVCYDLRFPQLARALAQAGADFISVPSAFTYTTGSAHWHVLLRARAIETGCYVIAPAQCGMHPGNRRTYGHSLIVSPWGEIVAEDSEDKTGVALATIDAKIVAETRAMMPSLTHDRAFGIARR